MHEKRQLRFVENVRVTSQIFKGPDCGWTCADLKEYIDALETLRLSYVLEGISVLTTLKYLKQLLFILCLSLFYLDQTTALVVHCEAHPAACCSQSWSDLS